MKKFRLNEKTRENGFSGDMGDAGRFFVEEYFHEALRLERLRTERSGRSFLLMLLHIERPRQGNNGDGVGAKIASTLFSSTRETDIKGWYKNDSTIGIIFTDPNGTDKNALKGKIMESLRKDFPDAEQLGDIRITLHSYPEGPGTGGNGCGPDGELFPDLTGDKSSRRASRLLKRAVDITGSLMGILIFLPIFIAIPLLIKLTSKGPVFFRQDRVGLFGRKFTFLKFRSMHVNSDHELHKGYIKSLINGQQKGQDGIYKIKNDPRVTTLGRFLRKSSLDEFPQFINVLKGEMSLVGPRPPIPYELEHYDIWHRRRVLETKPGITGLWQVRGRSSTSFDEMVRLDLKYTKEWSLWLDMKILLRTPWAVINCKGAY